MQHLSTVFRMFVMAALLLMSLAPSSQLLYAQDTAPIELDEAGFGVVQMDALDAGAQTEFTPDLVEGDRVAMDLQGESDALRVVAFRASYGYLFLDGAPGAFDYFANPVAGKGEAISFNATIEVTAAGEEPTPEPLTLDVEGVAVAEGTLDPQDVASYVLAIEAGASVQAVILPGDTGFVLTVVGADGNPLQTDHAGASTFDQIVPISQKYTFKVVNFGEETQAYQLGVAVTPGAGDVAAAASADGDLALGEQLVTRYFDALRDGDSGAVASLLSPAFQIVRASGERFDAGDYLDNLPVFESYALSELTVTRTDGILVATYTVRIASTLDAGRLDQPAPGVAVFQQIDGKWKLLAHADFTAPVTAPAILTTPESQVTITDADTGGAVQLVTGDILVVQLPANPTTGYDWRVVSTNDALLPVADDPVYASGAGPVGVSGVYTFRFLAKAAGEVTVQIAEFAPGADDPDRTLDFNATIIEPAPLTGNTIEVSAADNGSTVQLAAMKRQRCLP